MTVQADELDRHTILQETLLRKIRMVESGCWEAVGARDRSGRAHFITLDGKQMKAHRWAYQSWVGPIPEGMVVCHRCDNPPCCNPAHLFVGTVRDNVLDMIAKGRHAQQKKTHCPLGHPYDEKNTHYRKRGGRVCLKCQAIRQSSKRAMIQ